MLDIGLPTLNGIEAARQIRRTSPSSKILFISDNRSSDVAEEALSMGEGYLVKADAGHELLPAIKKVLEGKRFVSASLPALHVSTPKPGHYQAFFYSDGSQLPDRLTKFIGNALEIGHAALVIATELHRNSLVPTLRGYGTQCAGTQCAAGPVQAASFISA